MSDRASETVALKIGADTADAEKGVRGLEGFVDRKMKSIATSSTQSGQAGGRGWGRGFHQQAARQMNGWHRDANGTMRDANGRFVAAGETGGQGWGRGFHREAEDGLEGFHRDAAGRLRDANGRFVAEGEKAGRGWAAKFSLNAGKAFRTLMQLAGRATVIGTVVTGIAGLAAAAGSAAGAVVPLVTTVIALGAALPAVVAGGLAAGAALKVGFSGFAEALAGDEEALERLAPAARDVVDTLEDLRPAWDGVVGSVQQGLFAGIAGELEGLAATWLPLLESGLTKVAGGWNVMAVAAAGAAQQESVLQGFQDVTDDTAAGLSAAAKGLRPFLSGIGSMLSAFSPLLVQLGDGAADVAGRFGEWAAHMAETGQFQEMIETALDTLSTLGGIVGNVASAISTLFSSATINGGGFLGVVEDLTGQVDTFLKSAEGQDALNSLFSNLGAIGEALGPVLPPLIGLLANGLAPIIGDIATNLAPSLALVATELGDALSRIDIVPLVQTLGELLGIVAPLLVPLATLLNWVLQFSPIITPLAIALGIWTVAQWLLNVAMLANPIILIVTLIVALIATIILIATKTTWFQDLWDLVWGGIKAAAGAVADWWTNTAWPSIKAGFDLLADGAIAAKNTIVDGFNSFIDFFKGLPGKISSAASGMFDSVSGAFTGAINDIIAGWNGLSFSVPSVDLGPLGSVGGYTLSTPNIPYLAKGGIALDGGAAMVGEAGPEILDLPRGARVTPLDRATGSGGPTEIILRIEGDELIQLVREGVQVRGGDVQIVLGG